MLNRVKKVFQKNKKIICLFILFFLIIVMLYDIYTNEIAWIDNYMYRLIVENLRTKELTNIMLLITQLGSKITMIVLAILCIIFIKNKKVSTSICINLILVTIISQVLKFIIQRNRPMGYMLTKENGYSFPSGHSMVSIVFYGLIIYFINKSSLSYKMKKILTVLLVIVILLIGLSRIYLGVHYASDVISGFILGIIYLIMMVPFISKYVNKN